MKLSPFDRTTLLTIALVLFGVCGCSDDDVPSLARNDSLVMHAVPTSGAPPHQKLIPLNTLVGLPQKMLADISPDGAWISWLADHQGEVSIWVAPITDLGSAKPITRQTAHDIHAYRWGLDSKHLLYLRDSAGNEDFHVYSVNIDSQRIVDLTPFDGVSAYIEQLSAAHPEQVVIAINHRDAAFHDLYRINIRDGRRELIFQNEGFAQAVLDDQFNVRLVKRANENGSVDWLTWHHGKVAKEFTHFSADDVLGSKVIGLSTNNEDVMWIDTRDRDTAAVTVQNLKTAKKAVLFEHAQSDIENVNLHPVSKALRAVSVNYTRNQWHVLHRQFADDFANLQRLGNGEFWFDGMSQDDRRWIITYTESDRSDKTYLYDRDTQSVTLLFAAQPELDGLPLSIMHEREISASDGLTLVSYLSLPNTMDPDRDGVPSKPLPLVLLVHGGPWDRDFWGFNAEHQWLTNRGYAALSVNFRGSTGFGKSFTNAGNQEWAGKMQHDLDDAVAWAITRGIADPQKVAIFGASYGGYAALVGLTHSPDRYACAVDIVGPSNLETLLQNFPAYWQDFSSQWRLRVGDYSTPEGRAFLAARSPLTFVENIRKPLLIAQGMNDPRVTPQESQQIVNAMKRKKLPVTYVVFEDEGHGFERSQNSTAFYAVAEEFLARCLGGHMLEHAADFVGSSIEIVEGEEFIPFARDVLAKQGTAKAHRSMSNQSAMHGALLH